MSEKIIPAKTILVCDRCGDQGERGEGPFGNGGAHGKLDVWARGYDGAKGGISMKIDFCYSCSHLFQDFLAGKPIKGK